MSINHLSIYLHISVSGCLGMNAMGCEDIDSQTRIAEQGGLRPLVRLLRSHKTSERVLLAVIKALGTRCIGVYDNSGKIIKPFRHETS